MEDSFEDTLCPAKTTTHAFLQFKIEMDRNGNQDAVFYSGLSRAQDRGLRFWQTISFTIITCTTVPGDCIDRVTSQNGDRVLFERLATPRPPPKVTLKS